jgi:DNA-binding response OmpR family regulator
LKHYQMPVPTALRSPTEAKILIVDDNKHVVSLLKRALAKMPRELETEVAFDGFEAGRKIMAFFPDLVLLDLRLPGIDGFKVCKEIKSQKFKEIKVLAMTAYPSADIKRQILDCGADAFVPKPFELGTMIREVSHVLGWLTPAI